jgi:hypothetical protein
MIQELAGGHIPVDFSSPLSVMAHHRAGTVHILAVTSEKRLALLPTCRPWRRPACRMSTDAVVLPLRAGQHVARLGAAHPQRRRGGTRRSRDRGQDPRSCQRAGGETPEVFAQRVRSDLAIWCDTAKVAGIEPE